MSTDLVHVQVLERDERSILFVLTLVDPSGSMCLDPAFILQLFGLLEHAAPDVIGGPPLRLAAFEKACRKIADREPEQIVSSVEVEDVTGYPADYAPTLESFRDHPRETWPRATYRARFRLKDLLDFVDEGTEIASTAYDTRDTGAMVLPGGAVQKRWPGVLFSHVYTATRTGPLGLDIEVASGSELPMPAPGPWLLALRAPLRAIESDLPANFDMHQRAPRYLRSVELLRVEGPREAKGAVYLDQGRARAYGAARTARYHVELTDERWLAGALLAEPWGGTAAYRNGLFMPDPAPSKPGDVEAFEELLTLAREEGAATEMEMLETGLSGSRDVVLAALRRTRALGAAGASLAPLVTAWIGALDGEVVRAACAAAAGLRAVQLAPWVALASLRGRATAADRATAEAAAEALAAMEGRPGWCDAFAGKA